MIEYVWDQVDTYDHFCGSNPQPGEVLSLPGTTFNVKVRSDLPTLPEECNVTCIIASEKYGH